MFTSVGIVNDFTTTHIDGTVATRVKPSSRDKLLACAVVEDSMSPSDAASIASKLLWVTIGPVGRAATQPLRARQYAGGLTGDAGRFPISSSSPLMASVRFVIGLLETESIPDVVFRLRHSSRPKVTVWSDASWSPDPLSEFGSGRVAFIAKLVWQDSRERVVFAESTVPASVLGRLHALREQRTFITPLVEIAIAAPYLCPELADDIAGCDNTAANAALVKGYSASPDLAAMVGSLHLLLARAAIRPWFHFAPSALNPADAPSRGDFRKLRSIGATRVSFVFPDLLA